MLISTLSFQPATGWSDVLPTHLDSEQTAVFVFGAPDIADNAPLREALHQLKTSLSHSHLLGCSTSGEIAGAEIRDGTLSVAIAKFDRTTLASAFAPVIDGDSFGAGQALARTLDRDGLRGVMVLSDGMCVNGSALVRGLSSVLPEGVLATGGLAGDGARFNRTWVLVDGVPTERHVTAIGLYGDHVRLGHGSKGGWDIFGPERCVTRSEGNVLFEIDGKPALALYKKYLGEQASGLPSAALLFPLALRSSKTDTKTLVRTILAVDETANSMTFAGDIPTGSLVQLMRANFDRLIDGASDAALDTARRSAAPGESLTVAVSCVGRRLVLGERAEEEIDAALASLPAKTALVGFYSYGEISPFATGACDLHNQTMTLTNVWEAP